MENPDRGAGPNPAVGVRPEPSPDPLAHTYARSFAHTVAHAYARAHSHAYSRAYAHAYARAYAYTRSLSEHAPGVVPDAGGAAAAGLEDVGSGGGDEQVGGHESPSGSHAG